MEQSAQSRLIRVVRDPDLFSLTAKGNNYFTREHRYSRDKARLFLLKDTRKSRVFSSREEIAIELGGDTPSADARSILKGREANKSGPVVPSGHSYWPRFSKQLIDETGLSQSSRDISFLPMLSFADTSQLSLAIGRLGAPLQLDSHTMGLMLGISPRLIVQIIRNPSRHYRNFELRKRGGGTRPIASPRTFLKVIQQFLADYYLSGLPTHECVQSYRLGRSIISNASQHCGKAFVANIDIQNYFGSVDRNDVVQLLRHAQYEVQSAEIISFLCTKDGVLPQGAPTSPALSNAYLYKFDEAISVQCAARGLTYTRYADDISLSGDDRVHIVEMIQYARDFLRGKYGLLLNEGKTRIASHNGQQKVTGVVVNEAPRPPRTLRRKVRAAFNNASKNDAVVGKEMTLKLAGYLSYLSSFDDLRNSPELVKYRRILTEIKTTISKIAN